MSGQPQNRLELRIVGLLCIPILCGILVAGLWPFHAPFNQVAWLGNENGLHFGNHGTVLTSRPFAPGSSAQAGTSVSLEIWLQPRLAVDSNTILVFYTPLSPLQFSLHQSEANLAVRLGSPKQQLKAKGTGMVYVHEIFRQREPSLVAIASGGQGTRVYLNGVLASIAPHFRLSSKNFAGQLILGTSPVVADSWSGQMLGLALYQHELTAAQALRHFETWTAQGRPDLGLSERPLALYLFDEHQGRVVHDRSGAGIDLDIPERYMIVHEKFLQPPWKEFHQDWGYWKNVLINISGFIPLGFFFCAYWTMAGRLNRPALATVILGAAVSLTIEVSQAFLPTRDSGMTDLITNTLGTALGVMLFRWQAGLFSRVLNRVTSALLLIRHGGHVPANHL